MLKSVLKSIKVLKKYQLDDNFTYIELKKYNQTFIENIEEAKDVKHFLIYGSR